MHKTITTNTMRNTTEKRLVECFVSSGTGSLCVLAVTVCALRVGVVRAMSEFTRSFKVDWSTVSALPFGINSDALDSVTTSVPVACSNRLREAFGLRQVLATVSLLIEDIFEVNATSYNCFRASLIAFSSESERSQTSFTVLLKRILTVPFTITILAVASSMQCVLFQTIPATHLKLHPSVQLNDSWGLGITLHALHTVSDFALHFD